MATKAKPAPRKPARGRGKPKEPVVTEAVLRRIEDLHLRGFSSREIGAVVGVDSSTVLDRLEKDLRPRWKAAAVTRLEDDLARVALIERIAWEAYEESQKPEVRTQEKFANVSAPATEGQEKTVRKKVKAKLEASGASLELVERAVQRVNKVGAVAYLQIIQWCIEFRAKLGGYFEKDVAGATGEVLKAIEVIVENPEQITSVMSFEDYNRQLVLSAPNVIDVKPAAQQ